MPRISRCPPRRFASGQPECYLEERTVGPSLGADSIPQGLIAGVVGLVAVVIVMLVYYKRSGINATLALILNAVILLAALSYFDAVLTLPGIAGVILTIGMAVDCNVLIFERIREELRAGRRDCGRVDDGFSKAFGTIIDTHVTTVVSCAFLFLFGTAGEGFCGHAGDRPDCQRFHGGVCVEVHFRLGAVG